MTFAHIHTHERVFAYGNMGDDVTHAKYHSRLSIHTLALTYILLCSAPLLACSITVEDGGHSSTRYCRGSGKLRCAYTLYYFYCILKKVCLLIACCFFCKNLFFY